ncbi:hypothetical protein BDP27DRAFT_1368698 [Rhodocollybia butyracea]|uniref:Uncharacterized protein n=1 Tax=Rhodocollybia butyracea TaxID=206335 RepID=A0A9P5U194_9AGAR|nr:hypothetical protein BDP27DRAFT_1368698 [Rhodocollybia butyracea]
MAQKLNLIEQPTLCKSNSHDERVPVDFITRSFTTTSTFLKAILFTGFGYAGSHYDRDGYSTLHPSRLPGLTHFIPLKADFLSQDLHRDPIVAYIRFFEEQKSYMAGFTFYPKGVVLVVFGFCFRPGQRIAVSFCLLIFLPVKCSIFWERSRTGAGGHRNAALEEDGLGADFIEYAPLESSSPCLSKLPSHLLERSANAARSLWRKLLTPIRLIFPRNLLYAETHASFALRLSFLL